MIGREKLVENPFDQGFFVSDELRKFGFASVGENVLISKRATIIGLKNIWIGNDVRIDDYAVITAYGGSLFLGNYIHIGSFSFLGCRGGVVLEDFSGLSQGAKVYSASDDYTGGALTNPTVPAEYTNVKTSQVLLRRHVIVGAGTVILPGVELKEGVSVGAQSLVTKNLDAWGVYAGRPASFLRKRKMDLLEAEKNLKLHLDEDKKKNSM
ncbi:acyltransferase [Shinella sedimenti]|uniref:Acyltransferase n=1 Tax=Shinella sedimenti TaxID=2919913 RepID=A0ABT0CS08_9HYPH|nr:acyltransferase [Shinella sedimenti]MCJ8151403.1 acyltransferase [Shinella sedimenti]